MNWTEETEFKVCNKCHKKLPATTEYFCKKHCGRLGLNSICKQCIKKYREDNREIIAQKDKVRNEKRKDQRDEQSRQYYLQHREVILDKQRKHYELNKEKVRIRHRSYYIKNKEKVFFRIKEYLRKNKDLKRIFGQRSRDKSGVVDFDINDFESCKEYFNNACAYCGKTDGLTQDHIIPVSKNGPYTLNNIVIACRSCNSRKHNNDLDHWYPNQTFFSEERMKKIKEWMMSKKWA